MTSSNTRAVKRGHSSGHSTRTSTPLDAARRARVLAPRRGAERRAGGGVQLARDAVDAEAVGPVGRDLELEHVRRDRQHARPAACRARARRRAQRRRARGCPRGRRRSRARPRPGSCLRRRTPRSFACRELGAVGHDRARARHRDGLPGGDVRARRRRSSPARRRRARRDRPRRPAAGRRRGAARRSSTRPTTKRSTAPTPWWWIASTFVPVIVRRSSIAVHVERRDRSIRAATASGTLIANCSRKRRSFSK